MAKEAGEGEFSGVGGILTPASKGTPMRPEWEDSVLLRQTDETDASSSPVRPL